MGDFFSFNNIFNSLFSRVSYFSLDCKSIFNQVRWLPENRKTDPPWSASVVSGHFVGAWLRSVRGQVKYRVQTPRSLPPNLRRIV